jgi:hypothetical protein
MEHARWDFFCVCLCAVDSLAGIDNETPFPRLHNVLLLPALPPLLRLDAADALSSVVFDLLLFLPPPCLLPTTNGGYPLGYELIYIVSAIPERASATPCM